GAPHRMVQGGATRNLLLKMKKSRFLATLGMTGPGDFRAYWWAEGPCHTRDDWVVGRTRVLRVAWADRPSAERIRACPKDAGVTLQVSTKSGHWTARVDCRSRSRVTMGQERYAGAGAAAEGFGPDECLTISTDPPLSPLGERAGGSTFGTA